VKTIKSHRIVYFDVDDTLVVWNWKELDPNCSILVSVSDPDSDFTAQLMPHQRHIELLKQFKARGHTVVVWSAGGWRWAESAVKALGIEDLIDYVMSKPDWYVDDLHASSFMGGNVYLHPTDPSKDNRGWINQDGDS
jgi:phosphoserine phosphatase